MNEGGRRIRFNSSMSLHQTGILNRCWGVQCSMTEEEQEKTHETISRNGRTGTGINQQTEIASPGKREDDCEYLECRQGQRPLLPSMIVWSRIWQTPYSEAGTPISTAILVQCHPKVLRGDASLSRACRRVSNNSPHQPRTSATSKVY